MQIAKHTTIVKKIGHDLDLSDETVCYIEHATSQPQPSWIARPTNADRVAYNCGVLSLQKAELEKQKKMMEKHKDNVAARVHACPDLP